MALSNKDVAKAFVDGGVRHRHGSNTVYTPRHARGSKRTFTSYRTVVAVIHETVAFGPVLFWMDYKSASTQRQLSYVHHHWGMRPGVNHSVCVDHPNDGAGTYNVHCLLGNAQTELMAMVKPRIRMTTKIKHWSRFVALMGDIDLLRVITPSIPMTDQYRGFVRILDGNIDANPTGLEATILKVRAVMALEGTI